MEKNIVIVGASIAGSFCAYLLASQGQKVTLIDCNDLPKDKACGEGLSLIGKKYLEKAGLWKGLLSQHATPFYGYNVIFSDGSNCLLNSKQASGYSISREVIDNYIFNAASCLPNVTFIKAKTLSVSKKDFKWEVETSLGAINASDVVIAAGLAGRSLHKTEIAVERAGESRFGLSLRAEGRWQSKQSNQVLIYNSENCQILLTPILNNQINLSILTLKELSIKGKNTKEKLLSKALSFAADSGFLISKHEECRGARFIAGSKPEHIPEGLYYIGDTAEIFDPIGGMGMSHGVLTASLAAESLIKSKTDALNTAKAWKNYNYKRSLISNVFKLLTSLSYQLNVNENRFIKTIVRKFPGFALKPVSLITKYFPMFGAVNKINNNYGDKEKIFNLQNQELV